MSRRYMKLKEVMPLYSGEGSGRNFLRRYKKLEEDMPLYSGEDRGRYFGKQVFCIKTNVIYLLLPPE